MKTLVLCLLFAAIGCGGSSQSYSPPSAPLLRCDDGLETERSGEVVNIDAVEADGPLVKAPTQKAKEVDLDQKLVKTASMTSRCLTTKISPRP
ncbi:MAG: hypothetical protein R3E66_20380 [bacterium]